MDIITTKKCFKCEIELPLTEFYEHKQMADGHLNKCKTCTKNDARKRESELRNDPEWVIQERERHRKKFHRLGYAEKHKTPPDKKREIIKRYKQKYPEKFLASKYTEIYMTKVPGLNLHHWSYNQEDWLDVIELSIAEHNFIHRYIIYDQERMMYRNLDGVLLDTKEKHQAYLEECKKKYEA